MTALYRHKRRNATTEEAIILIPPGKLQCVLTGKLRPDTPEEHVRQRTARSLLEDYGYDKADIEIEFTVNFGSSKKRVDVAIFPPRAEHKQENVKIIVECKREEVRPTDRDNGFDQLKSYLSLLEFVADRAGEECSGDPPAKQTSLISLH